MTVSWIAPPGSSPRDWVGLYRSGASNETFVAWAYTGGAESGSLNFTAPAGSGEYEFRYLLDNGYTDVQRSNRVFVNRSGYSVTTTPLNPALGQKISVSWTAPAGSSSTASGSRC